MADAHRNAEYNAAREAVAAYHEAQLKGLVEHVRQGFARYDAGEIDAFELDDVIHHYKRAAQELWRFCVRGGVDLVRAARQLEREAAEGEETDWWEVGAPRGRQG